MKKLAWSVVALVAWWLMGVLVWGRPPEEVVVRIACVAVGMFWWWALWDSRWGSP